MYVLVDTISQAKGTTVNPYKILPPVAPGPEYFQLRRPVEKKSSELSFEDGLAVRHWYAMFSTFKNELCEYPSFMIYLRLTLELDGINTRPPVCNRVSGSVILTRRGHGM